MTPDLLPVVNITPQIRPPEIAAGGHPDPFYKDYFTDLRHVRECAPLTGKHGRIELTPPAAP